MSALARLIEAIPEPDIRLNMEAVLGQSSLSPEQKWGAAVTAGVTARHRPLTDALIEAARAELGDNAEPVLQDAQSAARLMGMNNVFYRFRHFVEKPVYKDLPARLRMNRLVKPLTNKPDFELFSLVASAINGCEICVRAHENGLNEQNVHDAVRFAATIHAAAISLE